MGLWTTPPRCRRHALLIPVDTHTEPEPGHRSHSPNVRKWKMAEEITARLAALDPGDPVKYASRLSYAYGGDCRDRATPSSARRAVCAPSAATGAATVVRSSAGIVAGVIIGVGVGLARGASARANAAPSGNPDA